MMGQQRVEAGEGVAGGIQDLIVLMMPIICSWNVKGVGREEKR